MPRYWSQNNPPYEVEMCIRDRLATTAVCEIPLLAGAFGFTSVEPAEYLVALLLSVLVVPIVELVKWIQRRDVYKRQNQYRVCADGEKDEIPVKIQRMQ